MKKIFYSIDMGSPSNSSGFYCWRWSAEDGYERYKKATGWYESIYSICDDYSNPHNEVHLVIEAPLWGLKSDEHDKIIWRPRFTVELDGRAFREYPWYVGAGAATGFMTQQFVSELRSEIVAREMVISSLNKIGLHEGYISGLQAATETVEKPESFIFEIKGNSHAKDAFELLVLLVNKVDPGLSSKLKHPDDGGHLSLPRRHHSPKFTQGDTFLLGQLQFLSTYFDVQKGDLLFTARSFELREKKSTAVPLKKAS